jgi:replicative DNA helicase
LAGRQAVYMLIARPSSADTIIPRLGEKPMLRSKTLSSIYKAIHDLYQSGDYCNSIAIAERLRNGTNLQQIFAELRDSDAAGDHIIETICDILVEARNNHVGQQYLMTADTWEQKLDAAKAILDLDAGTLREPPGPAELWRNALELQKRINAGETVVGQSWGRDLPSLDRYAPLVAGLWLELALKKGAKSHKLLAVADGAAMADDPIPAAFFSLEMSPKHIVPRLLARHTNIDSKRINKRARLNSDEMAKLEADCERISTGNYPLYLAHVPGIEICDLVAQIRAWAYKVGARDGRGIVCVDYLQQIHVDSRGDSEAVRLKCVSDSLAEIGYQLDLPIIAAAQLRNEAERRPKETDNDADPWNCWYHVSHLDGGGRPMQSAEGVLILDLLKRRVPGHPTHKDGTEDCQIIVAEQRSGVGGARIKCRADLRTSTFTETAGQEQNDFPF